MAARNAWASAWAARNATAHSSPAENTHANDGSTPPDWTDWPQELPRLLSVSHLTQPGSVGALLRPDPAVEAARRLKPNCTVCRGCNVELQKLSSTGGLGGGWVVGAVGWWLSWVGWGVVGPVNECMAACFQVQLGQSMSSVSSRSFVTM